VLLLRRLFQQRSCSHCGLLIGPEDFIIRVSDRLYHATRFCLICTLCHKPLLPGEGFYDHPPGIVCTSCVSEVCWFASDDKSKIVETELKNVFCELSGYVFVFFSTRFT